MKIYQLEGLDQDYVHDYIYEGSRYHEDTYIGQNNIEKLFEFIPESIHLLAEEWGWYDTEVGDKIVKFIKENYLELKEKIK